MSELESALRRLCVAVDDAGLEALASKGLVRRAQKDRERGVAVTLSGEASGCLRLAVESHTVTMPPAGPAAARCSCGATGICQHIIVACLWLREGAPEVTALVFNPAEWLALDEPALRQWAGKAALPAAAALADSAETDDSGRVFFSVQNIEVRLVPGAGPDGIIVSGNPKDPQRFAMAAIFAVQRRHGIRIHIERTSAVIAGPAGAPRSRTEVLISVRSLTEELIDAGLARLPADAVERYATLAVSALGADMPRLALTLRGIGDECRLLLTKHARADMGRLLRNMARAWTLSSALTRSPSRPDLTGTHRTTYEEAGHLELMGAGAWPWRTASGFTGLTVLFLDLKSGRWNSWTEARPLTQLAGFIPAGRFHGPSPWDGADSLAALAGSCFRLMKARRNATGRLSATSQSRVTVTGPADFAHPAVRIIDDWMQLPPLLAASEPAGLSPGNVLAAAAVIRPAEWGSRRFDSIRQQFEWMVADARGAMLRLVADYDEFTAPLIRTLEALGPDHCRGACLTGLVIRTATENTLAFSPRTLVHGGKLRHLMLEPVGAAPHIPGTSSGESRSGDLQSPSHDASQNTGATSGESGEFEEEEELAGPVFGGLEPLLARVYDLLLHGAESGSADAARRIALLQPAAESLRRTGLNTLAGALPLTSTQWARQLLQAVWVCELHSQSRSA